MNEATTTITTSAADQPVTEAKYKKALKRLARLETVVTGRLLVYNALLFNLCSKTPF